MFGFEQLRRRSHEKIKSLIEEPNYETSLVYINEGRIRRRSCREPGSNQSSTIIDS